MADLTFTVQALDKAVGTLLKVMAAVEKVGKSVDRLDGRIAKIGITADGAVKTEQALNGVDRKMKALDGKKATVKVDIDKTLSDKLIVLDRLGAALKSLALPAAAVALAPQIAALGAAAVSATGALGMIPGALGAIAVAGATVSMTFGHVWTALTGSDKKAREAMEKLNASGQDLVRTVQSLGPAWDKLRTHVQNQMFTGLADQVRGLAATYLPMLRTEMGKVGSVFNVALNSVGSFFRQKAVASDLHGALISIRTGITNVVLAARPLAQAFTDIFSVSASRIPGLTKGVSELALRFATFIRNARETGQLGQWIDQGIHTVKQLGAVVVNVGSSLMSIFRAATAQGASLVDTLSEATGAMAAFLRSAQGQAALGAFFGAIRAAIDAIRPVIAAVLPLAVEMVKVLGTNLVTVFEQLSGPLTAVATALTNALLPVLGPIGDALADIVVSVTPLVFELETLAPAFGEVAKAILAVLQAVGPFLSAFASTMMGALSLLTPALRLVAEVIQAIAPALEAVAGPIGAVVAGFLALKMAVGGITMVQAIITGLGAKLAESALNAGVFTEKITGSANAGEKLAVAGGRLSTALGAVSTMFPIIAAAVIATALTYEQMRDKSEELATSVVNGQTRMSAAVQEHANRIQEQSLVMEMASGQTEAMGQGIGELTGQLEANSNVVDANAQAQREMSVEIERQLSALPPLEQAQARVKIAQDAYNEAVRQFTANSPQAEAAAGNLALARDREKIAADDAARAEKSLGDAITEASQAAAAAANADVAYQQGLLNLAGAQDRAAETARTHAAGSRELQQANLQVMQANLQVADAARRKAEADAVATGATNVAQVGAQAYKDELIRLASQATGPTREALLAMANGTNTAGQAASTAELQSRFYKDELGRLAGQANGPLAEALRNAQTNFGNLGGAHATAEQRAAAQKAELKRLADMASGPVRTELLRMADQIRTLPDKTVSITAQGKYYIDPIGGVSGPGTYTGGILGVGRRGVTADRYDRGGVMPGYTPGRDVHSFYSPTAGGLQLSGGEAVMRPEWTNAVTPGWVHAANRAARTGGIDGVRQFLTVNPPGGTESDRGFATGGIVPTRRFAGGGLFMTGTPFSRIPVEVYNSMIPKMMSIMAPRLVDEIKRRMATMLGNGTVAGNVGAMMSVLRGAFPGLALISGFRPGAITATGNRSYHGMGRAVDVPPSMAVFNWIRSNFGARTKELIFSPAGGNQIWNGRPHMYTGITRANHWDHVHWAMRHGGIVPRMYDQGGTLPPGATLAINNTGRNETVVPAAPRGSSSGDLIAELRRVSAEIHALRGDVDHHGDNAAIVGQLHGLRVDLARVGASSADTQQYGRVVGELGPF